MKYRSLLILLMVAGMVMAQTKVKVDPQDAIVEIDGKEYFPNEGLLNVYLPDGLHKVTVMMQGYETYMDDVMFSESNREISISLKKTIGYLSVLSDVAMDGAAVYLDNKMVGMMPIEQMEVLCGSHSIVVVKKGSNPYAERITVSRGKTTEVNPLLEDKACHVRFIAGEDVEIWFDGMLQGVGEWTGNLDENTYTIFTKKQSHRNGISQIAITASDTVQEILLPMPQPIYGFMRVNVKPFGSQVTLDGENIGVTPLFKQLILVGKHTIEVKSGNELLPMKDSVEIKENATTEVDGELKAGGKVMLKCGVEDAKWHVDNSYAGEGREISVMLAYGSHSVTIETENFKQHNETFSYTNGMTNIPFKLKPKEPEYLNFEIGGDTIKFIKVKGNGTTINDFYISQTEVTQHIWQLVMMADQIEPRNYTGRASGYGNGDDYPMYNVSWNECMVFIRKLSKLSGFSLALPSEAQWKYVAKGGIYYLQEQEMDYMYWNLSNAGGKSHPVTSAEKNVLEVYGMYGNVAEMCMDQYDETEYQKRVCKGGSWNTAAKDCNIGVRRKIGMTDISKDVGFRLIIKPK